MQYKKGMKVIYSPPRPEALIGWAQGLVGKVLTVRPGFYENSVCLEHESAPAGYFYAPKSSVKPIVLENV